MGSLETDDPDNRVLCTSAKISIVTIDYRLSPEHPFPTQAEDSFAALKWVSWAQHVSRSTLTLDI